MIFILNKCLVELIKVSLNTHRLTDAEGPESLRENFPSKLVPNGAFTEKIK